MVDAQTVVALLNEASPDCPVSLMDFCQKSPQQLRELLMHVLSFIQPIQKDIDIDSPNASTSWVLDLLRMLNYHPPFDRGSFHTPWFAFWQHNCYLSFAILVAFRGQCDSLGEQFKTTHYHLECLHKDEKYPALLKENVPKLEAEREHLTSKISKIKTKIQVYAYSFMFFSIKVP
ncbi:hypothetical protein O6H91_10G026900 [Diphasiastrum complanatum]|uniref:Uncharacterized protein n=1 Tax=Diphasiastrum complanatum TaxID=34168 RepID=A0ACC2CFD1_DIPCM|nr:hypothetical protein O6H91_10G026900 [Diphasiastrum complanatum]